jgi:DNA-binding protein Fis
MLSNINVINVSRGTLKMDDGTTLSDFTRQFMTNYLFNLGKDKPKNLYKTLVSDITRPLIVHVLNRVRFNQVKTAKILGVSRGTLRMWMKQFGLFDFPTDKR